MAEPSSNTLGKRKAEETTTSSTPRKRFSAAELFNPTMVTIRVSESAVVEAGEEAESEEFSVPRAFLCSRSKYFETAFGAQWSEGKSRRLEIDDVRPWIFRVFIGWLFYDKIFYDEQRVDPEPLMGEKEHSSSKETRSSDVTEAEHEHHERHSHEPSSGDLTSTEPRAQVDQQTQRRRTPTGDHQDPRTWRTIALFRVYVFAEKYDTRGLRVQVFDIIQHKLVYLMLVGPRSGPDHLPSPQALSFLVDNMPDNASIVEMLAVCYMRIGSRYVQDMLKYYGKFPSRFLALCYLRGLSFTLATNCQSCLKGEDKHTRNNDGHVREDGQPLCKRDQCEFHEHGEDEAERDACKLRWTRRIAHYRVKPTTEVEMCD